MIIFFLDITSQFFFYVVLLCCIENINVSGWGKFGKLQYGHVLPNVGEIFSYVCLVPTFGPYIKNYNMHPLGSLIACISGLSWYLQFLICRM